jgi:hypothetical protein
MMMMMVAVDQGGSNSCPVPRPQTIDPPGVSLVTDRKTEAQIDYN